jgi:hypothetical protein
MHYEPRRILFVWGDFSGRLQEEQPT